MLLKLQVGRARNVERGQEQLAREEGNRTTTTTTISCNEDKPAKPPEQRRRQLVPTTANGDNQATCLCSQTA